MAGPVGIAQVVEVGDLPLELREEAAGGNEPDWLGALSREVERRFARGETGVMDFLSRDFEKLLISRALVKTGGRRIEAANLLGIGRNTITRKIADLGLEEKDAKPAAE